MVVISNTECIGKLQSSPSQTNFSLCAQGVFIFQSVSGPNSLCRDKLQSMFFQSSTAFCPLVFV